MGKRRISKILLFVLNVVYFLAAVVVLTIGSLSLSGDPVILDMLNLIENTALIQNILDIKQLMVASSAYLVALGSLAIILAFIGGCASLRDGGCLLICFGVSKMVIILFNLALIMYNSIVPYHGQDLVQTLMLDNLKINYNATIIDEANRNVTLPVANSSAYYWATMEFEQACCAAGSYEDYADVLVGTNSTSNISLTCCMQIQQYKVPDYESEFVDLPGCLASPPNYANPKGCINYAMSLIVNYRQVYILVAASFIVLEVLTISLSIRVHGGEKDRGVGVI